MNEVTRRFSSTVFITLGSTFGLHTLLNYFIDQPLFQNMIVESYCCNAIIAILIFWILVSLKEKYKNHIGFIFLFGSGTKFLMFFVIFYSPFKQDGEIIIYEFISFFLPYTICLILETYQLSKQLNKM
jgi:putative effector of murein hydrolase